MSGKVIHISEGQAVVRLRQRIAELERENASLCEQIAVYLGTIDVLERNIERLDARVNELETEYQPLSAVDFEELVSRKGMP